jgi:hypothetical protein
MSDRYTSRDARAAFEHLASVAGATIADPSWKITDPRRDGAWILDHNGVYGGYVIAAYVPSSPPTDGRPQTYTAETHPLGEGRFSARDFCNRCHFAARAIGFAKRPARERHPRGRR